jgi:hypothetical protein
MKKMTLLKTSLIACTGYILICGYHAGPASAGGYECTGAETGLGNPAGCSTGSGCHANSVTTGITVALELDSSGGKATKYYVGGGKYTIKLTGTNTLTSSQPKFGFQVGAIKGSTAQTTPTNAGTFPSPYPTNTHYAAASTYYVVDVVEQSTQLPPTSGSGGKGTTYQEVINWTAPATGTGTISIWAALNAVNDNGSADAGDLWNTTHIVINEIKPTGIAEVSTTNEINVYPNPFSSRTTFTLGNEVSNALLSLYDLSGREVEHVNFSGKEVNLERGTLTSGIYFYTITTENESIKTGKIVVQ